MGYVMSQLHRLRQKSKDGLNMEYIPVILKETNNTYSDYKK